MKAGLQMLAVAALLVGAAGCGDGTGTSNDGGTPDVGGGTTSTGVEDGGSATGGGDTGGTTGGGDTGGGDTVVICDGAPAPGPCTVTAGGAELLIVGDILTPGTVFEGGAVLVSAQGEISCVGCDCQAGGATVVSCPGAAVSPGLINAHDHLGWMNGSPWKATSNGVDPALRWEHRHDWRKGKNGNPKVSVDGGGAKGNELVLGELRFVMGGATAVFGSGKTTGLLRDLDTSSGGDNGLGHEGATYKTFPLGDASGATKSDDCSYPKLPSPSISNDSAYAPHVSEGIGQTARNEFMCMTGQRADGVDVLGANSALIHGVGLLANDVALMAQRGMKLIWSPRSNVSLYGETAQVTLMARMGVSIGLGTDWLPSGSMNMLRELKCADELNANNFGGYFSDEQIWEMATLGSAHALAFDDRTGVLKVGYAADIAIFRTAGKSHYRAVIDATPADVALVLRGGEALYGDADVAGALESGCDAVDVCGQAKVACISGTTGQHYGDLGNPSYPLFFCGEPDDEPTCLPARTLDSDKVENSNLFSGMSAVDDQDGDGILDADDVCPGIFNPIRPMDNGVQADFDGDGVGDVCDPCPLDKDTTDCTVYDPSDSDGDTIANLDDNCPADKNQDQADGDGDGKGDVCDPCPAAPNPGGQGCPTTIPTIKTDPALMDQAVAVPNVVVTALTSGGFFVQQAGEAVDFAGIYVYLGSGGTPPARGDVLNITGGTVTIFFDQMEIGSPVFEKVGGPDEPTPRTLSAADVAQMMTDGSKSAFEGMLVALNDVEVTNAAPEAGPGDDGVNEFEVAGGLRVDDAAWEGDTFMELPSTGDTLTGIVGVVAWRNGHLKVLPRSAGDVMMGAADVKAFVPAETWQVVGTDDVTVPEALIVTLNHTAPTATTVSLVSDTPAVATVPPTIEIAAGEVSATVPVNGVAVGTAKISATTAGGAALAEATVTVLAEGAMPAAATLDPTETVVAAGDTVDFALSLEHPAPAAGMMAYVSLVGPDGFGTTDATVSFGAFEQVATVSFVAGDAAAEGTLEIALSDGGAAVASATITVVAVDDTTLDLSGYTLTQTDSPRTFTFPTGTEIKAGGFVIVARGADKAAFETFWGVSFGPEVTVIDSTTAGEFFPSINGKETFTLADGGGQIVDGPTIAMAAGDNVQRAIPVGPAGDAGSWMVGSGNDATPGSLSTLPTVPAGLYISEVSDATGTGNYVFEFVEVRFDGTAL